MQQQRTAPPSAPCPPVASLLYLPALRIEPGRTYSFISHSNAVYGVQLHYVHGRSCRCPGNHTCPLAGEKHPAPHWYGYLVGLLPPRGPAKLLCITRGAYQYCPDLAAHEGHLRGLTLILCRKNGNRNGPLICKVGAEEYGGPWPVLPTVEDAVARLLGV